MKVGSTLRTVVPFFPAREEFLVLRPQLEKALNVVGNSGRWILGRQVEIFEKELGRLIGVKYVVSCASGTDAITLTLMAWGLGVGDEVVVPANCYPTVFGVAAAGCTPLLVDIDPATGCLAPKLLPKVITPATRAVLAVHLYGMPADVAAIQSFCKQRKLILIEDCAQAVGTMIKDRHVGTWGDVGVLSFYPTKNLGAYGDGGAVITNNRGLAERVRRLRMYGEQERYNSIVIGRNSRLDELQAAFLLVKLPFVRQWVERRRYLAGLYQIGLSTLPIMLPKEPADIVHSYHLFVLLSEKRRSLQAYLFHKGIETVVHYPRPIHLTQAFFHLKRKRKFLQAERWSRLVLSLPMHPFLTDQQVTYTVSVIKDFFS